MGGVQGDLDVGGRGPGHLGERAARRRAHIGCVAPDLRWDPASPDEVVVALLQRNGAARRARTSVTELLRRDGHDGGLLRPCDGTSAARASSAGPSWTAAAGVCRSLGASPDPGVWSGFEPPSMWSGRRSRDQCRTTSRTWAGRPVDCRRLMGQCAHVGRCSRMSPGTVANSRTPVWPARACPTREDPGTWRSSDQAILPSDTVPFGLSGVTPPRTGRDRRRRSDVGGRRRALRSDGPNAIEERGGRRVRRSSRVSSPARSWCC